MARRRWRKVGAKPLQLVAGYGTDGSGTVGKAGDLVFAWGDGIPSADAWLLNHHLARGNGPRKSLTDELIERGYDITTLRFSISKTVTVE